MLYLHDFIIYSFHLLAQVVQQGMRLWKNIPTIMMLSG